MFTAAGLLYIELLYITALGMSSRTLAALRALAAPQVSTIRAQSEREAIQVIVNSGVS